jgi:hypothetical protein
MAYTNDDLAALERGLSSPELRVTFTDGRSIEYRSIGELREAIAEVKASLASAGSGKRRVRRVVVSMEPGF